MEKECGKCGVSRPLSEYYRNKDSPDGRRSVCKVCSNAYIATYRKENPEIIKRIDAKKKRKYRERYTMNEAVRKARKNKLLDTLVDEERKEMLDKFKNKCVICRKDYEHLDHFIPIHVGHGGTTKGNIVPMCSKCNLTKQAKNPFEWAVSLGEEHKNNFDNVIEYLSEINGLSMEEYREFVFWCFENPRDVDEITEDNRDSLSIWLRENAVA